jgi:hypothetical protein
LDTEREAYKGFGMKHSLRRSWGIMTFLYYLKAMLQGEKWRGIRGDSAQLGGDVVVDADGIIKLIHRSDFPIDRPSVDNLLASVE